MRTLRLILGDQLNLHHSWFQSVSDDVVYLMAEMRQETQYVKHHAQKVLAIFAAMRDFADGLAQMGHRVEYVKISHACSTLTLPQLLEQTAQAIGATEIQIQEPDEWRLDQQIKAWSAQTHLAVTWVNSEHFLTTRDEASKLYGSSNQWLMERFYRAMRKKHGVLLDDLGRPVGGDWNLDHENRKAWKGQPAEPRDPRPTHQHEDLWNEIQASGVTTFGEPAETCFRWPLNRTEALSQWKAFVSDALPFFGDYQDAIDTQHQRLFHSLISFALNTKMLHPMELIRDVEAAYHQGSVPLNSAEGYIRQVLGWREYVRGYYWAHMPKLTQANHFDHHTALPSWFWTGKVNMACMQTAINQSLKTAYAHHIQRLMVIGNFSLLAGLDPHALHEWYLGVYIDAFEWVEAPNTLGMSQSATGNSLATKPYVSSAAYLHKMGNSCSSCTYKRQERYGEDACPFNALYWNFFMQHQHLLQSNPRLGMVYRQIERMSEDERTRVKDQAKVWLLRLEEL